jgi:hypothetical protein
MQLIGASTNFLILGQSHVRSSNASQLRSMILPPCIPMIGYMQAFGAGADYVMLGGMLAGHDESGGELVERGGQKFKRFYGMSSTVAMQK